MSLDPGQIAQAGDSYLSTLSADAGARARLAAASGAPAVAREIATATGLPVTEADVDAIAEHINTNRQAETEALAAQHPSMVAIVDGYL